MRRAACLLSAALALVCAAPASASRTVAADAAGAVHTFVVGTDGALYTAAPGDALRRLDGSGLAQEPVAVVRDASGALVVAAREQDGTVFVLPGGDWSARERVLTGAADAPELVLDADGRLRLFARGVDGRLWTARQTVTGWSAAEALEGELAGPPAAILDRRSLTSVFARQADGRLRAWLDDGGWQTAAAGSGLADDPAVTRRSDGRLQLLGRDTNGVTQLIGQAADTFTFSSSPHPRPLATAGAGALAADGAGRLHAFARGADGALWVSYEDGTAWTPWVSLGGTLTGDPAVVRDRFGLLHVVAPSTGASWLEFAQTAALTWAPTIRALGEAAPPKAPEPVVVAPAPVTPPVVVPPTYPPVRITVDLRASAKGTVFRSLTVRGVPAGTTVTATCAKGCRRKALTFTNVAGTVSLKPLFARRAKSGTLAAGTRIRVVVSGPNMVAAVKTLTVRARRAPSVATRCLPPGATTDQLCG